MFCSSPNKAWLAAVGICVAWCQATSAAPATKSAHRISFRTIRPVSNHFDGEAEVAETEKVLQQLGCETKRSQHDGHVDLSYECKFWRSLNLQSPQEVAKWNSWLTTKGFTVVNNTPAEDHQETVQYQRKNWKTLHFHDAATAKAHVEMFKMLGCEVTTQKHDGHQGVRVRCVALQSIGLPDHQTAHAWMQVLRKLGFTTFHEH